jgi:predicted kinase
MKVQKFREFVGESTVAHTINFLRPGMLKCMFFAGGPGSGKSTVAAEVFAIASQGEKSFSEFGLNYTSSDVQLEHLLRLRGIDLHHLTQMEANPETWALFNRLRQDAKRITNAYRAQLLSERQGIIYDGTGADFDEKVEQKKVAEAHGYDCSMIFVQTDLATAHARNRERDRVLPDDVVTDIWQQSESNRSRFQNLFLGRYYEVAYGNTLNDDTRRHFMRIVREPIENPIGRAYLKDLGYT